MTRELLAPIRDEEWARKRAADEAAGRKPDAAEFWLRSPHPLSETLPGVYREAWRDEELRTREAPFGPRFLGSLDDVLSSVIGTLDNFDAYLDVETTPYDFLHWLGTWVGADVDESWPEQDRRRFIGKAADLFRRRGTAGGLRDHLQIYTTGSVEVRETGDSSFSIEPEGPLPGTAEPVVVVLVAVDDPSAVTAAHRAKLEAVIRASKPAHVAHRLEVIGRGKGGSPAPDAEKAAVTEAAKAAKPSAGATDASPEDVEPSS